MFAPFAPLGLMQSRQQQQPGLLGLIGGMTGLGVGANPLLMNMQPQQPRPPQQPGPQPMGAMGPSQPAPQPTPQPSSQAPGVLGGSYMGLDPQTWFGIAGSLFQGAETGSWGTALQGIGGALGDRQARADQQDERDARKAERDYIAKQRGREDVEYERAVGMREKAAAAQKAYIDDPNADPALKRLAEMTSPEEFAALMGDQIITPLQKEQMDLQRQEISSRDALAKAQMEQADRHHREGLGMERARIANDRYLNSLQQTLGRNDAAMVAEMGQRVMAGRAVFNDINEIEEILNRNPRIFGSILDGDMDQAVRKLTKGGAQSEQNIADLQRIFAIGAKLARDELRGQTPVSNIDFIAAMRSGVTNQSMEGAVRAWIKSARDDYAVAERDMLSARDHMAQFGGLDRIDPRTGRSWLQQTAGGDYTGNTNVPIAANRTTQERELRTQYQAQSAPPAQPSAEQVRSAAPKQLSADAVPGLDISRHPVGSTIMVGGVPYTVVRGRNNNRIETYLRKRG